uniref:uncharacterized protein LOC128932064 n=1 Tax=Callithrix jacchus TaxID=9483 RepID=UPI0023DD0F28|nr:uncharacterized protein LOC128932064 [Callithrix jacchus]
MEEVPLGSARRSRAGESEWRCSLTKLGNPGSQGFWSNFAKGLARGSRPLAPPSSARPPPRPGTRPQRTWRRRPQYVKGHDRGPLLALLLIAAAGSRAAEPAAWLPGRRWPARLVCGFGWRCRAGCCKPGRARRGSARSWTDSGASAPTSPTTGAGASRSSGSGRCCVFETGLGPVAQAGAQWRNPNLALEKAAAATAAALEKLSSGAAARASPARPQGNQRRRRRPQPGRREVGVVGVGGCGGAVRASFFGEAVVAST